MLEALLQFNSPKKNVYFFVFMINTVMILLNFSYSLKKHIKVYYTNI